MGYADVKVGANQERAIVSLAQWYKRHNQPIEEELWAALHNIATNQTDPRAAVRAAMLIADRIDPAPKQGVLEAESTELREVHLHLHKHEGEAEARPLSVEAGEFRFLRLAPKAESNGHETNGAHS